MIARTSQKVGPTPRQDKTRNLKATPLRRVVRRDHLPPATFAGGVWHGTSRIIDAPARRRANRRTWAKLRAEARRVATLAVEGSGVAG